MAPILQVKDLRTAFRSLGGEILTVDGVTFDVEQGQTVGLVGESGCGKSVTALSVMQLLDKKAGRIAGGEIRFDDRDLIGLSDEEMRNVRGNEIAMIFQEPMTSLNPAFSIGMQIAESVRLHHGLSRHAAHDRAIEMLGLVKIPDPARRVNDYPHQFSGGQRQRVMIAMALACDPKLLIADEPTTALDVTVQAQILELLADLQQKLGMAVLLITHDLGVVAERTNAVAVMYAGKIVERASPEMIFSHPLHPYTIGLMQSRPEVGANKTRLRAIPGMVPHPRSWGIGCRFRDRCTRADAACAAAQPPLVEVEPGHWVACLKVQ
ncbi:MULTISPECIES: ABC transporter ATP-binding protein [unclassified Beijerinckia]|uniref:ABC transporter ATP-binding protein n=1 Tax=unclassified Beijerinckia TaxID=2638183 RepID=UPI000895BFD7|nr:MULTISPECIES: ABC transporter ATP-binding protein [unclassified Beijerinckia]MDH7799076.1 peptide/nickel transport system ATP-binding protein [Beijerinckia sp. GAS462]SED95890.1 peptide/nickel transport system ATP-binding protein [Beijerinckia sp. 28-YEA-48]